MKRPRYSDFRLIGRGGFGEVYWAVDNARERPVAVKILAADASLNEDAIGRFRREIRIHRELDDVEGVLGILDDGEISDRPFYASDFHPSGSLDRLQGHPVHPLAAGSIVASVARTLGEAHERGILHRDVKPSNLLLKVDGDVLVADFGVGWMEDDRTTTTGFVGSRRYAAPEVVERGAAAADLRSDVYSLGLVGLSLLESSRPTGGYEQEHARLAAVFERAARRDPAARHGSMAELAGAIEEIVNAAGDSPTIAVPEPIVLPERGSTPDPTGPRSSRLRARTVAAAASFLLIGSLAAWSVLGADGDRPETLATGRASTETSAPGDIGSGEQDLPRLDLDGSASSAEALELLDFAREHELSDVLLNVALWDFEGPVDEMDRGRVVAFVPGTCDQFCDGDAYEILVEGTDVVSDSSMYVDSGGLIVKGRFVVQSVSIQTGGVYSIALRALDLS